MVTIVPNTPVVHWLSADRNTEAWRAMTATITIGTEGVELDTGRHFYLDGGRSWQEWFGNVVEVEALRSIERRLIAIEELLRQVQYNTGEAVGENQLGINV